MRKFSYVFIMEIPYFNLADYQPIGKNPDPANQDLIIYVKPGTTFFYLYDKVIRKLFCFVPEDRTQPLVAKDVFVAYYLKYPENQIASFYKALAIR